MACFLRFDLKEHSKRAARLAGSARGRLSPNWIASVLSAITTFQLEQWQGHLRSQTEQCTLNDCPAGASGRSTLVSARKIGRAHVRNPVTNAHIVSRLLLEKKHK